MTLEEACHKTVDAMIQGFGAYNPGGSDVLWMSTSELAHLWDGAPGQLSGRIGTRHLSWLNRELEARGSELRVLQYDRGKRSFLVERRRGAR